MYKGSLLRQSKNTVAILGLTESVLNTALSELNILSYETMPEYVPNSLDEFLPITFLLFLKSSFEFNNSFLSQTLSYIMFFVWYILRPDLSI